MNFYYKQNLSSNTCKVCDYNKQTKKTCHEVYWKKYTNKVWERPKIHLENINKGAILHSCMKCSWSPVNQYGTFGLECFSEKEFSTIIEKKANVLM